MGAELLALAGAVAAWAWWLGPGGQQVVTWTPAPGWGLQLDGLSLLFLTLFLAVPAPALPSGPGPDGRAGAGTATGPPRLPGIGRGVARAGLALTALAAGTPGQIAGLALAVAGLALAAWPLGAGRALAPALLLPGAVSGVFDSIPAPGQAVPVLPWPLVGLALLAAAGGAGAWPFAGGPARPVAPPASPGSAWIATLYGAGSVLPLLRSLQAGTWDGWARLAALALGLLTLVAATSLALAADDLPGAVRAARSYLGGVLLAGLGLGSPAAVAGGLALFVAGCAGLALVGGARPAAWIGAGAVAALPPGLGFAGLWLLAGAAALGQAPLVLVAVPAAGLVVALALLRLAPPTARARPGPVVVAAALLVGGLLPGPFVDGILRPALRPLAAGLPALTAVQPWPGLGLIVEAGPRTVAAWPAWGLAATLLLALAGAELAARLAALRSHRVASQSEAESPSAATGPLVPAAATWARWLDPGSLLPARRRGA